MTKDQQIYGVFNYEEDEEPSSSNWNSRSNKKFKSKDYTTPVGFVKGGLQEGSKKDKKEKPKLVPFSDRYVMLTTIIVLRHYILKTLDFIFINI